MYLLSFLRRVTVHEKIDANLISAKYEAGARRRLANEVIQQVVFNMDLD